ncbi:MAG TPA: aminotransferase class IV [Streptosporangiaceae bacterium]|jgi:branched-subunit amino acid aminotransferase/4-amino-4-deoxychorismate lyase
MPSDYVRIEVNGDEADEAALALLEHEGWGHFTAMQVRGGRTRGLDLHVARLEAAHGDVYGRALRGEEIGDRIRHALGGRPDASVRVYGYWAGLIVTVREPQDMPRRPHSMTAQHFQRPLARLKHVGSWGQGRFREIALAAGFDEGLLVDEAGKISEGTITNVGFWRDGTVIWPDAPQLPGITMLILRRQLAAAGIPQADRPVYVQDLAGYRGMILCNARGWAPVSRVDHLTIPQDEAFINIIATAIDECRWDEI